jgi:ElaB/YqjD/DUF883 family membrane-anchored ribosome-binding protein
MRQHASDYTSGTAGNSQVFLGLASGAVHVFHVSDTGEQALQETNDTGEQALQETSDTGEQALQETSDAGEQALQETNDTGEQALQQSDTVFLHDCKIKMMCLTATDTLITVDSDCNIGVSIRVESGWEAQGFSHVPIDKIVGLAPGREPVVLAGDGSAFALGGK